MKPRYLVQEGVVAVKDAGAEVDDSLKHYVKPVPHLIAKPREEQSLYVAKAHDLVVSPNQESK